MPNMPPPSPLSEAKRITGWTSARLGKAVGVAPSTVRAYLTGRNKEHLTTDQIEMLVAQLRDHQAKLILEAVLAEIAVDQWILKWS